MYTKIVAFGALSACFAVAAAQNEVTLYDLSLEPAPTGSTQGGVAGQLEDVIHAVIRGGGEVRASAVAVDPAGATYYVGVQEVSVIPTTSAGRITTVVLPTPSPATFTFRADASRVFQEVHTTTAVSGVKVDIKLDVECTHDVDEDTPVEEGVIICKQKLVANAEAEGQKVATTVLATTTGQPVAVATVTNPANLTLPTGEPGSAAMSLKTSGLTQLGLVAAAGLALAQLL